MVTIRDATAADREAVYAVHIASIRSVRTPAYSDDELRVWEAGPAPELYSIAEQESAFLVAESEADVVGFADASLADAELEKLYVHPDYQRRGVARQLLEAIERRVRDHGHDSLTVEASVNAVPFYEAAGFRRIGTHEKTAAVDTESVDMTMVDMRTALR